MGTKSNSKKRGTRTIKMSDKMRGVALMLTEAGRRMRAGEMAIEGGEYVEGPGDDACTAYLRKNYLPCASLENDSIPDCPPDEIYVGSQFLAFQERKTT
jgi:hypothetical protein